MCLETPQWWQTWGLTWDLELDKSVLDSYLYHLFQIGAQILDLEVMEEEGLEEIAYPKPVLLELGFWELKTSLSFALDILSMWILA